MTKKFSNAAVCGFYGHNNYGDTLMQEWLRALLLKCEIKSVFLSDKDSTESASYKAISPLSFPIILLGGGGIITQNFWFFKDGLCDQIASQKLGLINVNLTNESIEPLKRVKNKVSFIAVRDRFSINLAQEVLGSEIPIFFAPDISIVDKFRKPKLENVVSICPNSYLLKNYFADNSRQKTRMEYLLNEIAEFAKWLKKFDNKISLVPSQIDKQINDNVYCGILDGMIGGADTWNTSSNFLENELIRSSLVISMRYHTTVFAAKYGIPFIDISHHNKSLQFLKDNNLLDHSIKYDLVNCEKLIKLAEKAKYSKQIKDFASKCSVSSMEDEYWGPISTLLTKLHE